jgi:ABC-type nitrate/sulfonate/bicarbonate transport system permease component
MWLAAEVRRQGWFLGSVVLFAAAWEAASRAGLLNELFYSSPSEIAATARDEFEMARLWRDIRVSTTEFVVGFVIAAAAGVPLGLVIGASRRLGYLSRPWIDGLNATPRVALLPLVILWVGLGMKAAIVIVFLGAFISILINTIDGVRTVNPSFRQLAQSFRASRWRLFLTVILPGTTPFIMTGLRLGVERALVGVFVAELFGGTAGLGYMIKRASDNLQASRVLFGVMLFIVLGMAILSAVGALERRFHSWRPSEGTS